MLRTSTAIVLTAVIVVTTSAPTAVASNFGATTGCGYESGNSGYQPLTNCVSKANNATHAVRLVSVGDHWPGMNTAVAGRLSNVYNPTDLTAYLTTTDPVPDVWVYDYYYGPNGFYGWVDCPADHSGIGGSGTNRWCRGQKLRFNGTYQDIVLASAAACHELGHTVGLRHSASTATCMYSPYFVGLPNVLDSHDVGRINANY